MASQKKKTCQYHLCRKKTRGYKCKYCGKYFCKEHIKAQPPGMPNFSSNRREDVLRREEWEEESGHPCPLYYDHWKKEREEEDERYRESLARLVEHKPKKPKLSKIRGRESSSYSGFSGSYYPEQKSRKYDKPFYYSKRRERIKSAIKKIVVLAIIGYLLYWGTMSGTIQNFFDNIAQNTPDNTNIPSEFTLPVISNVQPVINVEELERDIHNLINTERSNHGLSELAWNSILNTVARKHSQDMADRDYFSHDSPEGEDFGDRYREEKFNCKVPSGGYIYLGAENIFQNNLYDTVYYTNGIPTSYDWNTQEDIATSTVQGWMLSEGHRENILTPFWKTEGIGVAISDDDKVYITENFC